MNSFDKTILLWLNGFLGHSNTLDALIYRASDNVLVQGIVPATAIWFLWFRRGIGQQRDRDRRILVTTLFASIVLIFLARALAFLLPYRERPLSDPMFAFATLHPEWGGHLYYWSSFPSDHAVLFFSLAFGITLVSRPLGGLMFAHAAIIDSLPRMYLGFHYPTDVIAGACIGMVGTWYLMKVAAVQRQSELLVQWSAREPGLFHAGLAVLTLQLATMFDGAIKLTKITLYLGRSAYRHFL